MTRRRRGPVRVDEAAILDAVRQVSRDRYGDAGLGVGWTVWDVIRPQEMPSALMTAQKMGLLRPGHPVGSREWEMVLGRAGLRPAPAAQRQTTKMGSAGDASLQVRDDGEAYAKREGLLCAVRYVAVRRWCPRSKRWEVVGWQPVYMVI